MKNGKRIKIAVLDPIHKDAIDSLKKEGFFVREKINLKPKDLYEISSHYDALICRTRTVLDKKFFKSAKRIRCIGFCSTGYDKIDIGAAAEKNIEVLGLPSNNPKINIHKDGNFVSTAEHTILLILAALGNFFDAHKSMKGGKWEKNKLIGREFFDKTLGIIGLGRIGKLVALRASSFGTKIISYDPYVSKNEMARYGVKKTSLENLCSGADIITIHAPKTKETTGMLSKKHFQKMKKGAVIINTARAAIVKEKELAPFIKKGVIKYAVDVFGGEPDNIDYKFVKMDNIIATPHIAGSSYEALKRISINTAINIIKFFKFNDTTNSLLKNNLKKKL